MYYMCLHCTDLSVLHCRYQDAFGTTCNSVLRHIRKLFISNSCRKRPDMNYNKKYVLTTPSRFRKKNTPLLCGSFALIMAKKSRQ